MTRPMSTDKHNTEPRYFDDGMAFTAAGQALMGACRFSRQEYDRIEAAVKQGVLFLSDAAMARAKPGGIYRPPHNRQPFSKGRPSPGVRLVHLYRRRCEKEGRPIVILNRWSRRADLVAEVPGPTRDFSTEEVQRYGSVLVAYGIHEQADAFCNDRGSTFFIYDLLDTPDVPTFAFRMFEAMSDIQDARRAATEGSTAPGAVPVSLVAETNKRIERILSEGAYTNAAGNRVCGEDTVVAMVEEIVGYLRRCGLDDESVLREVREWKARMLAGRPGDPEIQDLTDFFMEVAKDLLGGR